MLAEIALSLPLQRAYDVPQLLWDSFVVPRSTECQLVRAAMHMILLQVGFWPAHVQSKKYQPVGIDAAWIQVGRTCPVGEAVPFEQALQRTGPPV